MSQQSSHPENPHSAGPRVIAPSEEAGVLDRGNRPSMREKPMPPSSGTLDAQGKPTTERSGVSEDDALRRAREELAQLEAQRVQLSGDVMEGRPEVLEEDERLRARIVELGHWLSEAEKEGTQGGGGAA
jgi:hypothetical protein